MIKDYLNQIATWFKKTGQDVYGKPIFAAPINIQCRFEGGMKLIKDKTGKDAVSQGVFYVADKVGLDDKLEYDGRVYFVLNFADIMGFDGAFAYRKVWV